MGTDIHLIAEAKVGDNWHYVPGPIIECDYCDGSGIKFNRQYGVRNCVFCNPPTVTEFESETEITDMWEWVEPGRRRDQWYSERNYTVFGMLADVAPDDETPPIDKPRGFPDDLSDEGRLWFRYKGGYHSASWVTLEEITKYEWRLPDRRAAEHFLERMQELAAFVGEIPCRLVFDFDS